MADPKQDDMTMYRDQCS